MIAEKMVAAGLSVRVSDKGVYETCRAVMSEAGHNDVVYIGGSTFVVADFLSGMTMNKVF